MLLKVHICRTKLYMELGRQSLNLCILFKIKVTGLPCYLSNYILTVKQTVNITFIFIMKLLQHIRAIRVWQFTYVVYVNMLGLQFCWCGWFLAYVVIYALFFIQTIIFPSLTWVKHSPPPIFVVESWLYWLYLVTLSLVCKLLGNSLDKWFKSGRIVLIRDLDVNKWHWHSFERYEVWRLKCPKHSNFCSYIVWNGRTLNQEMWFGNYLVWNNAKSTMENLRMKKMMLNCLWKSSAIIYFWS